MHQGVLHTSETLDEYRATVWNLVKDQILGGGDSYSDQRIRLFSEIYKELALGTYHVQLAFNLMEDNQPLTSGTRQVPSESCEKRCRKSAGQ